MRLWPRTFEGAHHGPCPRPLLSSSQVLGGVHVGGDEQAAGVSQQAQRGHLQLVVGEAAVKAHHHGPDLRRNRVRA